MHRSVGVSFLLVGRPLTFFFPGSVNMYASAWICTKKADITSPPSTTLEKVGTAASLEELHI